MEKLLAMDYKSIAGYVKNGIMGMVYDHNHSWSNCSKLPALAAKIGTLNRSDFKNNKHDCPHLNFIFNKDRYLWNINENSSNRCKGFNSKDYS
ncbi:hypothetical protein [Desulfobacula toluolica]|uniref:hypothetical protein n=1 Tax=Desulfobacula toluolica TaxID=28223 RepID=UPI0002FD16EA|nr:hypothetical protein [Desulfobacula toluolica]